MEASLSCFITVQSRTLSFTLTINRPLRHNKQNLNPLPFAVHPRFWPVSS